MLFAELFSENYIVGSNSTDKVRNSPKLHYHKWLSEKESKKIN